MKLNLNDRSVINILLLPLSGLFLMLIIIRRGLYKLGIFKTQYASTPVVVVGNITVGGTGKTPVIIALAKHLQANGIRTGVVSRGYKGAPRNNQSLEITRETPAIYSGDEPLLIHIQSGVPVFVNKKRIQAVRDLETKHRPDVILSDDGLQHYAMGRQLEIALLNNTINANNTFLLPAGPFREPRSRLKSVDFFLTTGNGSKVDVPIVPKHFIPVKRLANGAVNELVKNSKNTLLPLNHFQGVECYAQTGIAHPEQFFSLLKALGVKAIERAYPDHHQFKEADFQNLDDKPILMTGKDCVKCLKWARENFYYLEIEATLSPKFLKKLIEKI